MLLLMRPGGLRAMLPRLWRGCPRGAPVAVARASAVACTSYEYQALTAESRKLNEEELYETFGAQSRRPSAQTT